FARTSHNYYCFCSDRHGALQLFLRSDFGGIATVRRGSPLAGVSLRCVFDVAVVLSPRTNQRHTQCLASFGLRSFCYLSSEARCEYPVSSPYGTLAAAGLRGDVQRSGLAHASLARACVFSG